MIKVKVPATSANLGAGFDCLGLALGMYNYVYAEETESGLLIEIKDDSADFLPTDERNLVYCAMKAVYDKMHVKPKGLHIILENNVPVTRGLGSSSAGIVGGLVAANELLNANLSKNELLEIAADIEGHPDNVAPAIMGGLTINVMSKGRTSGIKNVKNTKNFKSVKCVKTNLPSDLKFAALIPDFFLPTKKSREVLPKHVAMRDAVFNTGRSALFVSSMMTGQYSNLKTAVDDRLHQRFRKKLIPHIDDVFKQAYKMGALGVYLSGAGPTVIAIVKADNDRFETRMRGYLNRKLRNWDLFMLDGDNSGAVACKI